MLNLFQQKSVTCYTRLPNDPSGGLQHGEHQQEVETAITVHTLCVSTKREVFVEDRAYIPVVLDDLEDPSTL